MKKIEVVYKTCKGNEVVRRVNTGGGVKSAVKALTSTLPSKWEVCSFYVVNEWTHPKH